MNFPPSTAELVSRLDSVSGTNLGLNAVYTSSKYDVRQYTSYYFQMVAQATTATFAHPVWLTLTWFDSAGNTLYTDSVIHWPTAPSILAPNLAIVGGTLQYQDVLHGPYMQFSITNNNHAVLTTYTVQLFGTTRNIPAPYYNGGGVNGDNILCQDSRTPAITTTYQLPIRGGYGPANMSISNAATAAVTWKLYVESLIDPTQTTVYTGTQGANSTGQTALQLSRAAYLLELTSGAAVANVDVVVVRSGQTV